MGRAFGPEDEETPGGHPIVVISDNLWKRRFGGDPSVIGKTLTLNGHPFSVAGVAPQEFTGTELGQTPDIWTPILMQAAIVATFIPARKSTRIDPVIALKHQ